MRRKALKDKFSSCEDSYKENKISEDLRMYTSEQQRSFEQEEVFEWRRKRPETRREKAATENHSEKSESKLEKFVRQINRRISKVTVKSSTNHVLRALNQMYEKNYKFYIDFLKTLEMCEGEISFEGQGEKLMMSMLLSDASYSLNSSKIKRFKKSIESSNEGQLYLGRSHSTSQMIIVVMYNGRPVENHEEKLHQRGAHAV